MEEKICQYFPGAQKTIFLLRLPSLQHADVKTSCPTAYLVDLDGEPQEIYGL